MKINEKKIESVSASAIWEGNGKAARTMVTIRKLLGALGCEAEVC